jgi:hypothetical protein
MGFYFPSRASNTKQQLSSVSYIPITMPDDNAHLKMLNRDYRTLIQRCLTEITEQYTEYSSGITLERV